MPALYRGAILARDSLEALFPRGEHVIDGEHALDVGDGFYALIGRDTPDRLLVVLLSNGRKLLHRGDDHRQAAVDPGSAGTVGASGRGPSWWPDGRWIPSIGRF